MKKRKDNTKFFTRGTIIYFVVSALVVLIIGYFLYQWSGKSNNEKDCHSKHGEYSLEPFEYCHYIDKGEKKFQIYSTINVDEMTLNSVIEKITSEK